MFTLSQEDFYRLRKVQGKITSCPVALRTRLTKENLKE